MVEWIDTWPSWLQGVWFAYITFHDFIQWGIMGLLAHTAWGERQKKREVEKLLEHIHKELHTHITEDSLFHEDLGQSGMTQGS